MPARLDPTVPREFLAGVVERVTFHNPDNGFCVLRVQVPGKRALITVVGHAASIVPGEQIQASGVWARDRAYGMQFRAAWLRAAAPTTLEGIERYLASGSMKGIGRHFAGRLVEAFGGRVFDVIEREPDRLRDVGGIGPVRARRIAEGWAAQRAVRDIMLFLHSHGVGTSRAARIYKTYGADAVAVLTEDPYRLARDIHGIGFVTADRIAGKLGIAPTAMVRRRAGIAYALLRALDDGHCALPEAELLERTATLLGVTVPDVVEALDPEVQAGGVVRDSVRGEPCVFLASLYAAERAIAAGMRTLSAGPPAWPAIDGSRALPWVERRLRIELAEGQRDAFRRAVSTRVLVITGGPGVGKTTLLNAVLLALRVKGVRLALAAPTGRAAKRLSETTGVEARTIHRLLEVNPRTGGFRRNERLPLDADLVVVDETSMVDVPLMHALVRAVPRQAGLLLVGDVDQLPSVGPGRVLADVIESGVVPVVRLTHVFRQAAASRIVVNAHRVNRGELPELSPGDPGTDYHFVKAATPEDAVRHTLQIVRRAAERLGCDPRRDVQVLCPMNRGAIGAHALNLALQQMLQPASGPSIERFGWRFGPGDRVMQTENDYEKDVYNGDIGFVQTVDADTQVVGVDFDGRLVEYPFAELDTLSLAYAITIHKAQGSEYPVVVLPLTTQHYVMLQRNLLYTGMTRGRRLVVLVGQPRAVAIAVRGRQARRWTKLGEWLAS